jgi:hypothetical protein
LNETTDYVTTTTCALHRELIETKLAACNARVDGILTEIQGVRDLQRMILYALIAIGFGVACTLAGVIVGRGLDFGWLIP